MHKMTKLIEARQILKSLVISYFHLVVRLFFLISIFIRPHQRRIHSFVLSSISTSLFLFLFLSLSVSLSLSFSVLFFPFPSSKMNRSILGPRQPRSPIPIPVSSLPLTEEKDTAGQVPF